SAPPSTAPGVADGLARTYRRDSATGGSEAEVRAQATVSTSTRQNDTRADTDGAQTELLAQEPASARSRGKAPDSRVQARLQDIARKQRETTAGAEHFEQAATAQADPDF